VPLRGKGVGLGPARGGDDVKDLDGNGHNVGGWGEGVVAEADCNGGARSGVNPQVIRDLYHV
jgi:hypothetical protein